MSPVLLKKVRFFFFNFNLIILVQFKRSQHAVFSRFPEGSLKTYRYVRR